MTARVFLQATKWIMMGAAVVSAATAYAGSDGKESRKELEKQLRQYYKMQPRRSFFDPRKMLLKGGQAPSVICVVQQRGLMVKFPTESGGVGTIPTTEVKDGKITATGSGRIFGAAAAETRPLRIGELVHLTEVNVEKDRITVFLRTVEPETWFTRKGLLQGAVDFLMEPQAVANLSQDAFLQMAWPFFLTDEEAAKLPPPTVALGQTPDEVTAILGKPTRVVNLGAKEIYAYADMKIIFVDGKVSDVQ